MENYQTHTKEYYNKYPKEELIQKLLSRDMTIVKQSGAISRYKDLANLTTRRMKVICRQINDIIDHPYSKDGYRIKTAIKNKPTKKTFDKGEC